MGAVAAGVFNSCSHFRHLIHGSEELAADDKEDSIRQLTSRFVTPVPSTAGFQHSSRSYPCDFAQVALRLRVWVVWYSVSRGAGSCTLFCHGISAASGRYVDRPHLARNSGSKVMLLYKPSSRIHYLFHSCKIALMVAARGFYKCLVIAVATSGFSIFLSAQSHSSVLCSFIRDSKEANALQSVAVNVSLEDYKVSDVSVQTEEGPRRIVIVQDVSGSMGEGNGQKVSMAAIADFVGAAPGSDQLALVDFNSQSYLDMDFRSPNLFIQQMNDPKFVKKLRPAKATALYNALFASISHLQEKPEKGDSVFIISDAIDNGSQITVGALREKLLKSKIRAYLLILGSPSISVSERHDREQFVDAVLKSGGAVFEVTPLNNLELAHPSLHGRIAPIYDSSASGLDAVRPMVEAIHQLIERPQEVTFDVDPPLRAAEKLNVMVGSQDPKNTSQNIKVHCPYYLEPN